LLENIEVKIRTLVRLSYNLNMTKVRRLLLLGLFTICIQLEAQLDLRWDQIVQGSGGAAFSDVTFLADGSCVMIGYSSSAEGIFADNNGNRDGYLIRYDIDGSILWDYVFGGSQVENFNDIVATADGGFIVAGSTNSSDGDLDEFGSLSGLKELLVKFSADGTVEWLDSYSSGNVISVNNDSEGNIYTIAPFGSLANGNTRTSKYDSDGIRLWNKTQPGSAISNSLDMVIDDSGNVYRITEIETEDNGYDFNITKFDAEGNELWSYLYGGNANDQGKVIAIQNGELVIAGSTRSTSGIIATENGNTDIFLANVDFDGTFISTASFGGSDIDNVEDMKVLGDKIFVTGYSNSVDNDFITPYDNSIDIFLAEINLSRELVWVDYSGGSDNDLLSKIDIVSDSLISLGYASTSQDGNLEGADEEFSMYIANYNYQDIVNTINVNKVDFDIYPNPTTHTIIIDLETYGEYGLKIFDGKGSLVLDNDQLSSNEIDIRNLPSGMLSVSLHQNGVIANTRSIFKQ